MTNPESSKPRKEPRSKAIAVDSDKSAKPVVNSEAKQSTKLKSAPEMTGAVAAQPAKAKTLLRPEIQALRAVAVMLVIVFHLWPKQLAGGYIGVDVFFVISGFLITAHLMKEVESTGKVNLPEFWARRVRRLLPAAFLVTLVTALAVFFWVPEILHLQFFSEIVASTFYVLNWLLAFNAVDYLAAENIASPVQHYWSLSVEEQFYIVWPIIILLAALLAIRIFKVKAKPVVAVVLALIVISSFAYSLYLTATNPASAYFVTPTRAWQFGLGGLLAIVAYYPLSGFAKLRAALSWLGLLAIIASALLYDSKTPFPGVAALLPVLGTLLVIWAGNPSLIWSPTRIAELKPVQWLGDISYSAYLWHWPPIVILPYLIGADLNFTSKLGILAGTILLAWLTKIFVEDPARSKSILVKLKPRWSYLAMVTGMVLVAALPAATIYQIEAQAAAEQKLIDDSLNGNTDPTQPTTDPNSAWGNPVPPPIPVISQSEASKCLGALNRLKDRDCSKVRFKSLIPSPSTVTEDKPIIYTDECRSQPDDPKVRECVFGPRGGTRVALIGDSHSASIFPALYEIAKKQKWELHVFFKGSCSFTSANLTLQNGDSCMAWNKSLQQKLSKSHPYDYVFVSHIRNTYSDYSLGKSKGFKAAVSGFEKAWKPLQDRGAVIIGIRDNPKFLETTPECVADSKNSKGQCDQKRSKALSGPETDALYQAALKSEQAVAIDLTEFFCDDKTCFSTVGGVAVWRDRHHYTASFAKTLTVPLTQLLREAKVIN